jgi:hypothetical protein
MIVNEEYFLNGLAIIELRLDLRVCGRKQPKEAFSEKNDFC